MKHLFLKFLEPESDAQFLNETKIQFYFAHDKPNDSGWIDVGSGMRIIDKNDSVIFIAKTDEEETLLKLRYGQRICDAD